MGRADRRNRLAQIVFLICYGQYIGVPEVHQAGGIGKPETGADTEVVEVACLGGGLEDDGIDAEEREVPPRRAAPTAASWAARTGRSCRPQQQRRIAFLLRLLWVRRIAVAHHIGSDAATTCGLFFITFLVADSAPTSTFLAKRQ